MNPLLSKFRVAQKRIFGFFFLMQTALVVVWIKVVMPGQLPGGAGADALGPDVHGLKLWALVSLLFGMPTLGAFAVLALRCYKSKLWRLLHSRFDFSGVWYFEDNLFTVDSANAHAGAPAVSFGRLMIKQTPTSIQIVEAASYPMDERVGTYSLWNSLTCDLSPCGRQVHASLRIKRVNPVPNSLPTSTLSVDELTVVLRRRGKFHLRPVKLRGEANHCVQQGCRPAICRTTYYHESVVPDRVKVKVAELQQVHFAGRELPDEIFGQVEFGVESPTHEGIHEGD